MRIQLFADPGRSPKFKRNRIAVLLREIVREEGKKADNIGIVLVNDDYLLDLNKKFLNHRYRTDVISFELSGTDMIDGEIYISVDRAAVQARRYKVPLEREVLRLMIHGVLHLTGWEDSTRSEKLRMRRRENEFIERFYGRRMRG
ncbi:MAG: rRNA maturation RNase YbeY [Bacteroidetes bacterium]|nr:rRNA maturation RNase YbeY [Bacteroidota bacterium]